MKNSFNKRQFIFYFLPVSIILLFLVGSCKGPATPSIKISSPSDSLLIASSSVTVNSIADKFNLVDKIGQPSAGQDTGHIVYYLDVTPPTHEGRTALTQRGTYATTSNTSYTWNNLRPGIHTLGVQLVTSDNIPLYVPQSETIKVTVIRPPTEPTRVDLIATQGYFNLDLITVPAGGEINFTLVNDGDTPLNFAIYRDSSVKDVIFRGEIIPARSKITYHFNAPGLPGDYFFQSDTRPDSMTGTLRVIAQQG